jgi:UDP-N-acetylglucosamine 2-epimerase (non-hydrolysing)/GDP/UDP-N,N'-diacetylbacillosamine 2-epimerase (hydrolysing)
VLSISETLARLQPELLVVYADRFEGFAAVIAGTQTNTPTAHVEGGDLTEGGALDDSVRHAMTKLAHLHFTTNQQATNRILAMGEEPWRVHMVGFPAIDLIARGQFASADEVVTRFGLTLDQPIVVFTQHSVTTQFDTAAGQVTPALTALEQLADEGVQVILTYPNNDAGGRRIIASLNRFVEGGRPGVQLHRSVGRHYYHGLLALARNPNVSLACAGNSSSGIKETPAFGCPTVNIGSRQDGRLRAGNVIDADYNSDQIHGAINRALFYRVFRMRCRSLDNPYGTGEAGRKISDILARASLGDRLLRKKMTLRGKEHDGWFR